jgi:hypothetical protein
MMRIALVVLCAAAASCGGEKQAPVPPAPRDAGTSVMLRRHKIEIAHLIKDPERRYPANPGVLCSWDRDRYLHFFSSDSPHFFDIAFLDATGRVVEIAKLAASSDVGLTSRTEVRHALFLTAGALEKDGLAVGESVKFSSLAKPEPMPVVKVAGHAVHVETAHLSSQRQRGLMHRPRLSKDDGMLFLYYSAGERSFYMLNTLIPLDISYFDAEGNLLNVARMKAAANPAEGDVLRAPSLGDARYVLEVNYGWYDERKLIDADGKPLKPVKLELPESLLRLADQAD